MRQSWAASSDIRASPGAMFLFAAHSSPAALRDLGCDARMNAVSLWWAGSGNCIDIESGDAAMLITSMLSILKS